MSGEELKRMIEYIDSRIRRLEEEIRLLKSLREVVEDRVRGLSAEPSWKEIPAMLSEAGGGGIRAARGNGASPTSCQEPSWRN